MYDVDELVLVNPLPPDRQRWLALDLLPQILQHHPVDARVIKPALFEVLATAEGVEGRERHTALPSSRTADSNTSLSVCRSYSSWRRTALITTDSG